MVIMQINSNLPPHEQQSGIHSKIAATVKTIHNTQFMRLPVRTDQPRIILNRNFPDKSLKENSYLRAQKTGKILRECMNQTPLSATVTGYRYNSNAR
jgi:hypothetical protein